MSEWQESNLGELCSNIQYGYTASATNEPTGIKFLRITDIQEDFINWDTVPYCEISENDFQKYKLQKGDICIARTGNSTGAVGFIKNELEAVFASYLIRYQIDKKKADPLFVNFLLRSSFWKRFVNSIKGGSAQAGANAKSFAIFPICLPPLEEQKAIADVLSCLDGKIENLRRQNETLEAIAQTLFKHWFMDFEFPNEDGKPYKSSGGAMIPSELGEIPEGWRVGTLGDIIEVNPKESIKKGSLVRYVEMKSLSTSSMEITSLFFRKFTSGSKFRNHDTLLPRITPCLENGKTAYVNILEKKEVAYGSTEFIVMRAKENCCPEYVYTLARDHYFRDYVIKNMTGSSGRQRVPNDRVLEYKIPVPDLKIIQVFQEIGKSTFEKIKVNHQQIQTLTKTRDTLLPKLMSGQLRVKEQKL